MQEPVEFGCPSIDIESGLFDGDVLAAERCGNTRTIKLTQGQCATVDSNDYESVSQYKWCAWWHPTTRAYFACRASKGENGKGIMIKMHREIMKAKKDECIIFNNSNTLDYRKSNLKICTRAETGSHRYETTFTRLEG
jgi:hypothetical protein